MCVQIYCSNDSDKMLFETVAAHKTEIEAQLPGEEVSWERLDDGAASRSACTMLMTKN